MNNLDENNYIINKINKLYENNNIPNIIFHGKNLSGKKTIIEYLLKKIYISNENIKKYVLIINCAHGKGNIRFIRENLKHFANIIVNNDIKTNKLFKTIILLNADKLTIDAQSALRRCIEIYNHSTRFFITVDDKCKILKPIISRFSDIYCNQNYNQERKNINIYTNKKLYYLNKLIELNDNSIELNDNLNDLSNNGMTLGNNINEKNLLMIDLAKKLYNDAFSGNLLIQFIKNKLPNNKMKYEFLFVLDIYKKEIRNEILIILFCLNFIFFRNIDSLENLNVI